MDEIQPYLDGIFRWFHVVAGIIWIGLLYFFNWVNTAFAPTLDADSTKKVVPELLPRTLFWFRWGAAWTWVSGVLLLAVVFYHGNSIMWEGGLASWGALPAVMVAITFLGVFVYDALASTVLKAPQAAFFGGWVLVSALFVLYRELIDEVSYRGALIHIGAMFGTFMAYNVWFRIWPAQQKVITAVKNGQAPDADQKALAGIRSKHNTYMSFGLIFAMLNEYSSTWSYATWIAPIAILVSWAFCWMCYQKAKKVPGF